MFEIALQFGSYRALQVFLLAGLLGVLLLSRAWDWLLTGRRAAAALAAALAVHVAALAAWTATIRVDSDEAEHLHCAWLVAQGLTPFRDFWQNHSPTLHYLLAPVVPLFHSAAVLIFSRALASGFFLLLAAAAGWLTLRAFGDRAAAALSAIIVVAMGIHVEGTWLRPDPLANLLVVISLAFTCVPAVSSARAFAAAVPFGFALSLTPKPFLVSLAFPMAVLLARAVPARRRYAGVLFYLLGGIVGALPLFLLLWRKQIFTGWLIWTAVHPAEHGRLEAYLPAALGLLAAGAAVRVFFEQRDSPAVLPALALVLQTLGTVLTPYRVYADLMLWVALASVLGSGMLAGWIRSHAHQAAPDQARRFALLAAAAIVFIEIEAFAPLLTRQTLGDFRSDRSRINWMIQQAGNRPVVLVTPVHSVFSRDATGLYHLWQYNHWLTRPMVAAYLRGFGRQVIEARPALIAYAPRRLTDDPARNSADRPKLFQVMALAGLIDPAEQPDLQRFLDEHYTLREFEDEQFLVWVH